MPKARTAADARRLEDIPNIGPASAGDLRALGIQTPQALRGRDPQRMYADLCTAAGTRLDPCVLDVLTSAVRFMEGAPALPWWHYSAERKQAPG